MSVLTRPTRGRFVLWLVLALLWFLFLPQELAMDPHHRHWSWVGAVFWLLVLIRLVACAWLTRRRLHALS